MSINLNIKFDSTSSNQARTAQLGCAIVLIYQAVFFIIQHTLDRAHKTLFQSSISNVTSIEIGSLCGIPYDDCRCSVQTAKNVILQNCLTDRFLLYSLISPQVLFILQIYFVQELFTISGKYSLIVIYCLRITAAFIFIFIVNGIYHQNSCFHRGIHVFLCTTNSILFVFASYGLIHLKDMADSQSRHSTTTNGTASVEIINGPIPWQNLL